MRLIAALVLLVVSVVSCAGEPPPKPLLSDFLGLNGHTVTFKPKVYRPAVALVRDYHPFEWDVGDDTSFKTTFPMARNKVSWEHVYGSWRKEGYTITSCVMFPNLPAEKWKNMPVDAFAYGKAFAKDLGPGGRKLVDSIEIGNEPGHYEDAVWRTLFENMAKGVREGDPKLTITTCASVPGKSHKYAKSLECVKGLETLYDVINIHTYAEVQGWPTWRRSFPEDASIKFLKDVEETIEWRNKNAPGKPIWITEFGWDSSTKKPNPKTEFKKWEGSTDLQQAQYIVRATMVFSAMDVERAYIFFFDDKDEPQVHAAAGLTRNGVPKPSFHAVSHFQKLLGGYRFSRVILQKADEAYVYEFVNGEDAKKKIWAIWSPTGSGRKAEFKVPAAELSLAGAERMPLTATVEKESSVSLKDGQLSAEISESPIYVQLEGR